MLYPAVHGKAKLEVVDGVPVLTINNKQYRVETEDRVFRLVKDNGESFNVSLANRDQPRCDCGDATFRERPGGCKHLRSLVAVGLIKKGVR